MLKRRQQLHYLHPDDGAVDKEHRAALQKAVTHLTRPEIVANDATKTVQKEAALALCAEDEKALP